MKRSGENDIESDYISSDEDEQAAENWEPAPINSELIGFICKFHCIKSSCKK
jgi:hypothetical protein